jgi:hypothetical protein
MKLVMAIFLSLLFTILNCESGETVSKRTLGDGQAKPKDEDLGKDPTIDPTPDPTNPVPTEDHVSPRFELTGTSKAIYGIVNNAISKWDPAANNGAGGWVKVTDAAPTGLTIGSKFFVRSEKEVYVIFTNAEMERQICIWNGSGWMPITNPTAGMGPAFAVAPNSEFYGIIGSEVCKWDPLAAAWVPVTSGMTARLFVNNDFDFVTDNEGNSSIYAMVDNINANNEVIGRRISSWSLSEANPSWAIVAPQNPNMTAAFHVNHRGELYATFNDKICKFVNNTWVDITPAAALPIGDFQFVSENEIYVVLGNNKICWWDGKKWAQIAEGNTANGLHLASHKLIYAVIGKKICKWDDVTQTWAEVTGEAPLDIESFQFISENRIYAILTDGTTRQICLFDGNTWRSVTSSMAEMKDEFHITKNGLILAVIGDQICFWNVSQSAWNPFVEPPSGFKVEIEFSIVSLDEIYAVLIDADGNKQICKWDGDAWSFVTPAIEGMSPIIKITHEKDIYAVIGRQICKWDAEEKSWKPFTVDAPDDLTISAIHFSSSDEIYVVFSDGDKRKIICMWDGKTWRTFIPPLEGLKPYIYRS